jgi:hypothetical protein
LDQVEYQKILVTLVSVGLKFQSNQSSGGLAIKLKATVQELHYFPNWFKIFFSFLLIYRFSTRQLSYSIRTLEAIELEN